DRLLRAMQTVAAGTSTLLRCPGDNVAKGACYALVYREEIDPKGPVGGAGWLAPFLPFAAFARLYAKSGLYVGPLYGTAGFTVPHRGWFGAPAPLPNSMSYGAVGPALVVKKADESGFAKRYTDFLAFNAPAEI